jgi:hypothetical protein
MRPVQHDLAQLFTGSEAALRASESVAAPLDRWSRRFVLSTGFAGDFFEAAKPRPAWLESLTNRDTFVPGNAEGQPLWVALDLQPGSRRWVGLTSSELVHQSLTLADLRSEAASPAIASYALSAPLYAALATPYGLRIEG